MTLDILIKDNGKPLATTVQLYGQMWLIPQNDAPVIEAPIQLRGQEDEEFSIASLRVEDVDAGESFGATLRVQLSVRNGQIQLSKFFWG